MLLTVLMLSWQVLWMSGYGKRYASSCYCETERLLTQSGYYSIAILVALTVLREGAEVVLFLYSLSLTSTGRVDAGILPGGIAGLLLGGLFYGACIQVWCLYHYGHFLLPVIFF